MIVKKANIKYQDAPRYPKIQTNGYEKELKDNYKKLTKNMILDLSKKMYNFKTK